MKQLGVFLLPLDGMLVNHRSFPLTIYFAGTHLYSWVERGTVRVSVLPKNTTQCPRSGLEPRLLAPGTSTLTMRPLHFSTYGHNSNTSNHFLPQKLRYIGYSDQELRWLDTGQVMPICDWTSLVNKGTIFIMWQ